MRSVVVTIGETMGLVVNDIPGPITASRAHTLSFGGAESNVATALERLGVHTAWVSRLGADPCGELIARELRAEGVGVHAIIDAQRSTGFMHKQRRTSRTARVTFWREGSAASALSIDDVPVDLIASADVLHLTGILPGLSDSARVCALHSARVARDAGTTLSFDINHRAGVWGDRDAAAVYREFIELSDVVFAGSDEAALVVPGESALHRARALEGLGVREVVIKRGNEGAMSLVEGREYVQPAVPVDVVDTVGAGDAFVAGYLSALLDDLHPQERLARATATGALACTVLGDWEGVPTHSEIADLTSTEGINR